MISAIRLGMYENIRTFKRGAHVATFDGNEQFLTAPPVPPPAPKDGSAPKSYVGWQRPNSSKVDEFRQVSLIFCRHLPAMRLTNLIWLPRRQCCLLVLRAGAD